MLYISDIIEIFYWRIISFLLPRDATQSAVMPQ